MCCLGENFVFESKVVYVGSSFSLYSVFSIYFTLLLLPCLVQGWGKVLSYFSRGNQCHLDPPKKRKPILLLLPSKIYKQITTIYNSKRKLSDYPHSLSLFSNIFQAFFGTQASKPTFSRTYTKITFTF